MNDVELAKAAMIERCLARVIEEYGGDPARLMRDQTRQDAIILNILRACEAAIDLAMHRVRLHRLGAPQDARDAFTLLERAGQLEPRQGEALRRMVGFRNLALHEYQKLQLPIVQAIIERELETLRAFARLRPQLPG